MADSERNRILAVDDRVDWRESVERVLRRIAPELTIRLESTREGALMAITEEAAQLFAVITDNHLLGEDGEAGAEIAQSALDAGVPRVAILTGRPEEINPPQNAVVLSKLRSLRDQLTTFLKI